MPDLNVSLDDFERSALKVMAGHFGLSVDEMAESLLKAELDEVICGIVFDRPCSALEVTRVQYH